MLITKPKRLGEEDLLFGHEMEPFEVRALDGRVLAVVPATVPWTHESLQAEVEAQQDKVAEAHSADFYLGSEFIGSTEV